MVDPISDMLTRIRNAIMAKKEEVSLPYSKIKFAICKILEKEKLINKFEVSRPIKISHLRKTEEDKFRQIKIFLKYEGGKSAITNLKRISRPGRRFYVKSDEIPRVLNGLGLAIISTSRGLMTDREARKKKVGGEVICEIY